MNSCSILWCGKYSQEWENLPHQHEYYQIFVVSSGEGEFWIEDEPFPIQAGQLYLIAPGVQHAISNNKDAVIHLNLLDIKFSIPDNSLANDLKELESPIMLKDYETFAKRFDEIIKESQEQKAYYYQLASCYLLEILIDLVRLEKAKDNEYYTIVDMTDQAFASESKRQLHPSVDFQSLDNFLQSHYTQDIQVKDIAEFLNFSPANLNLVFKEAYGQTPIAYVNELRLKKAKELLSNTDYQVKEIAEIVGFNSTHYFSRYFKAKENITATEFRRKNRQNFYIRFQEKGE